MAARALKIAVSGASGLIGAPLVAQLTAVGHEVRRIVRMPTKNPDDIYWNQAEVTIDTERLEGLDAVIHLAGEPVLSMRWSSQKKMQIYGSRVRGTELLSRTLARLERPPRVLLSASGIGYYGSRGDERLTETSPPGSRGFLTAVCQDWETATAPAAEAGIRTACLRFGIVLTPSGGALGTMLVPFYLGLGGRYGRPDQYLSWIALDDTLRAIDFLLHTDDLEGPFNITSPFPVRNDDFARTLGQVVSRPARLHIPPAVFRLLYGEVANETVLQSARVFPDRLLSAGFSFLHSQLEPALRHLLGRPRR